MPSAPSTATVSPGFVPPLVDIPSPTGDERPLAEWIAGELAAGGITTFVQPIDDRQANAVAELGAAGDGPDLMLYAPIDTLTTGNDAEDVPWLAAELPDHARPISRRHAGRIVGLGAHNPKGHAACVMAAVEALAAADVTLRGRLIAAFGAGGMPTNARAASAPRRHTGHGVGASFLLERGVWADAAVIAKSGWAVAWEEVGLAWIDVEVAGIHTYVGARHRLPYRNPIVGAGRVAAHLEAWFPEYSARHPCGLNEPQGIVAAAEAGWWRMAAVVPASARLRVDLRLVPGQSPLDAWRELDAALDDLRHGADPIDVHTRLAVAVPGSQTPPDHWITTTAIDAWERVPGDRAPPDHRHERSHRRQHPAQPRHPHRARGTPEGHRRRERARVRRGDEHRRRRCPRAAHPAAGDHRGPCRLAVARGAHRWLRWWWVSARRTRR